jgi:hypothetical protein
LQTTGRSGSTSPQLTGEMLACRALQGTDGRR